ncbi:hypothetical protein ACIRU8_11190 [Streptomyces sp. NPDC101175]|uniref:hypothetical protein n=1 Tax=Streptomyces sp. NPDC101175 TaxID=3366123 RepID=UPI003835DB89
MTDVTRPNGDTGDSDTGDERKGASTDTGTSTGTGTGADRREPTVVTPIPRQSERQSERPGERQSERPGDRQDGKGTPRPVHAPEPPPAPVATAPTTGTGKGTGTGTATATAADKRHDRPAATDGSLLPHDESDKFSLRLQHAVTGFVDEPRSAVEEAAHVLEDVADRLAEAVTRRRDNLHKSWESAGPDDSDTEQLRLALRDYRELTERLLHI